MLKKSINMLLYKRHHWRTVSFDELSEIYANVFLRSLANGMVSIFVPIYLYKLGYSLSAVFAFLAVWFMFRPLYDLVNAKFVGRYGPKHGLVVATIGQIIYLLLLVSQPSIDLPLWLLAQVGSISMSLYLISFHTDFSKIKHSEHGGKEISYLGILEKTGGIIGPLIGGLLANFFDPRYAIATAICLQLLALVPLFQTAEPVKTRQVIRFRGLPWRRHTRDFISTAPFSVEGYISIVFWPLFLAVVVIPTDIYAKIGIMTALSTAFSLLAVKIIGAMIDESKGGLLLRSGVVINAGIHFLRPFVTSFAGAVSINLANDPVTAAYRMPYMKGVYDASDSVPGYRIAYLAVMSIIDSFSKFAFCVFAYVLSLSFDGRELFAILFISAGVISLGILLEKFPALRT